MTYESDCIADRVRQLEDRSEIADLIHLYALYIRSGRSDEIHTLFTEDGVFRVRQSEPVGVPAIIERLNHVGRDMIAQYFVSSKRSGSLTVPMVRNILIEIDGDFATSSCLMESRNWPAGTNIVGEYHDSFRRVDKWRFSSRIFTIFNQPAASA